MKIEVNIDLELVELFIATLLEHDLKLILTDVSDEETDYVVFEYDTSEDLFKLAVEFGIKTGQAINLN